MISLVRETVLKKLKNQPDDILMEESKDQNPAGKIMTKISPTEIPLVKND